MLKADHHKKHVYEYRGIEGAKLPSRCQEISDPAPLFRKGYTYYHLLDEIEINGVKKIVYEVVDKLPY